MENHKDGNKKDLGDFILKLEGKRPTCWNFVSGRLSQQHVKNQFEAHRKFSEEKYSRSLQRTAKSCEAHIFGVHRIYIYSIVTEDVKKDRNYAL